MRTIYVTARSAPTAGAAESADSPYHKSVLICHNWQNPTKLSSSTSRWRHFFVSLAFSVHAHLWSQKRAMHLSYYIWHWSAHGLQLESVNIIMAFIYQMMTVYHLVDERGISRCCGLGSCFFLQWWVLTSGITILDPPPTNLWFVICNFEKKSNFSNIFLHLFSICSTTKYNPRGAPQGN
jgi:hypothetical protein